MDRRHFLKIASAAGAAGSATLFSGCTTASTKKEAAASTMSAASVHPDAAMDIPKAKGQRTVIIGGGVSGLTIARYLRQAAPDMQVVLLERNATYQFCPLSNLYMVGGMDLNYFCRSYLDAAKNGGYLYAQSTVYDADLENKMVYTDQGKIGYDWLVIAPGIDYNYTSIGVKDPEEEYILRQNYPAGFMPGSEHISLKHKLENFKGGIWLNTTPAGNYRCLPAPYERTCLVADFMKKHKIKGKVIHLDANPDITIKKKGFHAAFNELYKDYVEYIPNFDFQSVDVAKKTISSSFDTIHFDDAAIYPRVRASKLIEKLGINKPGDLQFEADIDPYTYAVKGHPDVFVTGDSRWMPYSKSANTANSEGHFVAQVIANRAKGKDTPWISPHTICFSMVEYGPVESISVSAQYAYDKKKGAFEFANVQLIEKWSKALGDGTIAWGESILGDISGNQGKA